MKRDYFGLFFISHIRLISVCKRRNNHCTSVIWLHSSFWFCFFDVALVIWQLHHTTANEINKWLTKFGRRASNDFNWLKNAGRNVEQLIGERCNILNIWKINHLSCAGLGRCETVLFSDAMHYMPQSFLSGWDYKPYYPVFLPCLCLPSLKPRLQFFQVWGVQEEIKFCLPPRLWSGFHLKLKTCIVSCHCFSTLEV